MNFKARPELSGNFGMVSSTHWIASQVGMGILERGGNAFDATVASGFVLQVVEPHQNGPGGDLTGIFARADDKEPVVLSAQGPAPSAATIDRFEDLELSQVPGTGLLAAAIPGATLGWLTLLKDHGTMSVGESLDAAIHYAAKGFPVTQAISDYIGRVNDTFRDHWPTNADTYLINDRAPEPGQFLTNAPLARTYQRLVAAESDALDSGDAREKAIEAVIEEWSSGFVAEAINEFCKSSWRDSSGKDHSGLLTSKDLAEWRPHYESPVSAEFDGYTVCKPGFWSQGPVLLQQLKLLEPFDLRLSEAESLHHVIEASKLSFADRDAWFGDTDEVPHMHLLDESYLETRRPLISPEASLDLRPGSLRGVPPKMAELQPMSAYDSSGLSGVGEPNAVAALLDNGPSSDGEARTDTVHVDVVDQWGNIVSAMPSGGWLHSSPVIPKLGFPLGTRLQMAWLERGLPNSLAPGKRPRTTLSPTLVMDRSEPVLACGSPGGDQQDQWQLQLLISVLREGRNLQEAIEHPAFHSAHFPSSFFPHERQPGVVVMEDRFGLKVIEGLRSRGHRVGMAGPWDIGRLCAVRQDPDTRKLFAGANPRGMQGYAVGR